jgi:hypothetical protein
MPTQNNRQNYNFILTFVSLDNRRKDLNWTVTSITWI